jgi:hypothetical protein
LQGHWKWHGVLSPKQIFLSPKFCSEHFPTLSWRTILTLWCFNPWVGTAFSITSLFSLFLAYIFVNYCFVKLFSFANLFII